MTLNKNIFESNFSDVYNIKKINNIKWLNNDNELFLNWNTPRCQEFNDFMIRLKNFSSFAGVTYDTIYNIFNLPNSKHVAIHINFLKHN
jgi:hypothetical protein